MIYLLKAIAFVILSLVLFLVGKELIFFIRAYKYIRQKITLNYNPIVGFMKMFKNDYDDKLEGYLKFFETTQGKTADLLLVNSPRSLGPFLLINDKDLLADLAKVETQVTQKFDSVGLPIKNAFLYEAGNKALDVRSIFSEIFYPSNLKKISKQMKLIIERHLENIKQTVSKAQETPDQFVEIELRKPIDNMMTDLVNCVLFGEGSTKIKGVPMTKMIETVISMWIVTSYKGLNVMTLGLYRRLGFDSAFNQVRSNLKLIHQDLRKIIEFRTNSSDYVRGVNLIDLVLKKNDELRRQGKHDQVLTTEQTIDNIFLIIFAGMDTSRKTTESSLFHLSERQDLQSLLRTEVKETILAKGLKYEYDAYDNNQVIDLYLKEILRISGPIPFGFLKIVTKNFQLGRYKIYKGTCMSTPYNALHRKGESFTNPSEFDMKRFEAEGQKSKFGKYGFQPFALGKRACIGKNLAEISIKMALSSFLTEFEMKAPVKKPKKLITSSYGLERCRIGLRITSKGK